MSDPSHISALLIAPPAAEGNSGDMYLTEMDGDTVLGGGLDVAATWPVDHLVLVLGTDAERLLDAVDRPIEVVIDPGWAEGPAAPLRAGIDLIGRAGQSDRVLVAWLDRPLPDAATVAAVIEAGLESTRPVAAAKYRYDVDHPYLVHSELWPRLLGGEGGASLVSLVATHPEWLVDTWLDRVPPRRYRSAQDVIDRR